MSESPQFQEGSAPAAPPPFPVSEPPAVPNVKRRGWVWSLLLLAIVGVLLVAAAGVGFVLGRQTAAPVWIGGTVALNNSGKDSSEKDVRVFLENIRARRPIAAFEAMTEDYQRRLNCQEFQKQLEQYRLPDRVEAIGAELKTLPPIDDRTHQYRYATQTTDGRPVVFTVTIVRQNTIITGRPWWQVDQLLIDAPGQEVKPK